MRYRQTQEENGTIRYRATQRGALAAEFSYRISAQEADSGREEFSFWLNEIRLAGAFAHYETMEAVLHFVCDKCRMAGKYAVYVRIDTRNLFYLRMYERFGFYPIAQEMRGVKGKACAYEYIMKYPLPQSAGEAYRQYLRRRHREE